MALNSPQLLLASTLLCLSTLPVAASDETPGQGQPSGFFYGAAIGASSQVYDGADEDAIFLPLLGYRGENLTVFGPAVNWNG